MSEKPLKEFLIVVVGDYVFQYDGEFYRWHWRKGTLTVKSNSGKTMRFRGNFTAIVYQEKIKRTLQELSLGIWY